MTAQELFELEVRSAGGECKLLDHAALGDAGVMTILYEQRSGVDHAPELGTLVTTRITVTNVEGERTSSLIVGARWER